MDLPIAILGFKENNITKKGKLFETGFTVDLVLPSDQIDDFRRMFRESMKKKFPQEKHGYTTLDVRVEKNNKDLSITITALEEQKALMDHKIDKMEDVDAGLSPGAKAARQVLRDAEFILMLQKQQIFEKYTPRKSSSNMPSIEHETVNGLPDTDVFIVSQKDIEKELIHDAIDHAEHDIEEKMKRTEAAKNAVDRGESCLLTVTVKGEDKKALMDVETGLALPFKQMFEALRAQMIIGGP